MVRLTPRGEGAGPDPGAVNLQQDAETLGGVGSITADGKKAGGGGWARARKAAKRGTVMLSLIHI